MKIYTSISLTLLIDQLPVKKEICYYRFLSQDGIYQITNQKFYKLLIEDNTIIHSNIILDNSIYGFKEVYNIPYPSIRETVNELYYKWHNFDLIIEYVNNILSDYYFTNVNNIDQLNELLSKYS